MRIYFSGIGGVGIGPLALIAKGIGHDVLGSDSNASRYTDLMREHGVDVFIGQDGSQIKQVHEQVPIDWLVVTSALPPDHPEIVFAEDNGIKHTKRDELLNRLISDKKLKLIAVSGTHGKTTTTGMLIWLFKQLGVPVSYSVGSDLSYGPSGHFDEASEYFIYEADEYDRNFLRFKPYISLIPSVDYDHPDTFPTEEDYQQAFVDFILASHCTFLWKRDAEYLGFDTAATHLHIFGAEEDVSRVKLAGEHNRHNGFLSAKLVGSLFSHVSEADAFKTLSSFPGTGRRFEEIAPGIYSDYAHHPVEIAATIEHAKELNDRVVVVYQPHQNQRQHQVKDDYEHAFEGAQAVYWLPTYLSREDPQLEVLQPQTFIDSLANKSVARPADMDDGLRDAIQRHAADGVLVLLMSAGTLDEWARQELT